MHYEDFVIRIGSKGPGGYSVQVEDSPAGQGAGLLQIPFDPNDLGTLMGELGRRGHMPSTAGRGTVPWFRNIQSEAEQWTRLTLEKLGGMLYDALFQGEIKARYVESLGRVEGKGNGLRLVVKQDPRHPDLARIFSLPWEYLFRSDSRDFLSLSRKTPVVRYPAVPRPESDEPLPARLRILALVALPTDLTELDLEAEREQVQAAWCTHPSVKIDYFEHANLAGLRQRLLDTDYHVLHFMGHGGFDHGRGQGLLYFENGEHLSDPVSGDRLATFLKDFKSIRLIFLNACQTGQNSTTGVNPFAGVAAALVLGGMPAVLAMQFPISDRAAIAFGETFYRRLAAGDPVDTAVVEGRLAIHGLDERGVEWGTPVLYSRVPRGLLFAQPEPENTPKSMTLDIPPALLQKRKPFWLKRLLSLAAIGTLSFSVYVAYNPGLLFAPGNEAEAEKIPAIKLDKEQNSHPIGMEKEVALPGGVNLVFVWVPPGTCSMGNKRKSDESPFTAIITRGFWIGKTEITQDQYKAITGQNPSEFKGGNRPVENINYLDAIRYANQLSDQLGMDGFRLPTEAEWEHACRTGKTARYSGKAEEVAWYLNNSEQKTQEVATRRANNWGVYDMHGNVWEWVLDWKGPYPAGKTVRDPKGPKVGSYKILRGGSYNNPSDRCDCANRWGVGPRGEHSGTGFRLVLDEE